MKKRIHAYISGNVQGVFFRRDIKAKADELGVKGFVRNLEDGRVEAVFEGDSIKVDKIIEFCKNGPKFAQIKSVDARDETYSGDFKEFKIVNV